MSKYSGYHFLCEIVCQYHLYLCLNKGNIPAFNDIMLGTSYITVSKYSGFHTFFSVLQHYIFNFFLHLLVNVFALLVRDMLCKPVSYFVNGQQLWLAVKVRSGIMTELRHLGAFFYI